MKLKILHIAQNTNGYEEVTLLANRCDEKNSLSVIEKNGEVFMTGGFLIQDTPAIRKVLDTIPRNEQYEFIKAIKVDPFAQFYYTTRA
jgi:hypothetical protein